MSLIHTRECAWVEVSPKGKGKQLECQSAGTRAWGDQLSKLLSSITNTLQMKHTVPKSGLILESIGPRFTRWRRHAQVIMRGEPAWASLTSYHE